MLWHPEAVSTLTMAYSIHPKSLHCLLVHDQVLFTLEVAVLDSVGATPCTVTAATCAKPLYVIHEVRISRVVHNFFEAIKRLLQRLPVVPVSPLQPHRILLWSKTSNHELRRRSSTDLKLCKFVAPHGVAIEPMDISEALYGFCFRVLQEIPDEKTLTLALYVKVVARGGAGGRSASGADCRIFDSN